MTHDDHRLWAGAAMTVAGAILAAIGERQAVYGVVMGVGVLILITSFGTSKE